VSKINLRIFERLLVLGVSIHTNDNFELSGRYLEAIEFLYSENEFIVSDVAVMEYLPELLLPQRINSMRNLRFTWAHPPFGPYATSTKEQRRWCIIWRHLSTMQGLRKLEVRLDIMPLFWERINEEYVRILMEPIRDVKGVEEFILVIPFLEIGRRKLGLGLGWEAGGGEEGGDPWEGLPCRIRRVDWHLMRS
jgi:hypothetical protein